MRRREKDKLLANAQGMAAGLSVRKTAEKLQVSVKKAFGWDGIDCRCSTALQKG